MEAAGLALGVISLAGSISGSFISIIQCFEYVQLGRSFGRDFEKSQLRLCAVKLRLTRLGVSLGVLPNPRGIQVHGIFTSQEKATQAKRLVDTILQDVTEIEQRSNRYRETRLPASTGNAAIDTYEISQMNDSSRALSRKTGDIIADRLKETPWTQKAKWALYEKRHFDTLLGDISDILGILENLFPEALEAQKALCVIEVENLQEDIHETTSLRLLCEASEENADDLLVQAVRKAILARGSGHDYARTEVDEGSVVKQGDYIASNFHGYTPHGRIGHNYGVTIIRGQSKLRQGDSFGEGDVL